MLFGVNVTFELLVDHVTSWLLAFDGINVAFNSTDSPTLIVASDLSSEIPVALTVVLTKVILHVADIPLFTALVAVTVQEPSVVPVIIPLFIVATLEGDTLHVKPL